MRLPSLISGVGSTIEAAGELTPELQVLSQINESLPEEQRVEKATKVVGEAYARLLR